jgi:hypothetical protein
MTYNPINVAAYTAAFSGAVAGMATSGWITDQTSSDYTNVTLIAGAFAQAFDQIWNNATPLNNLEEAAITAIVQTDFRGRGPGPFDSPTFQKPNNWTQAAGACAALVLESDIFFTNQGVNPGSLFTTNYAAIGNGASDTLALQAKIASAASGGVAVQLVGPNTIEMIDDAIIGRTIPSYTRLTASPDTQIYFDQPSQLVWYTNADNEIPCGTIAVTQTICNVLVTSILSPTATIGGYLWVNASDSGGLYNVVSIGQATIGTTNITTPSLYGGSSTLDGLTLILNVNGAGLQTLILSKANNVANETAFLAAILAKWPALNLAIADGSTNNLVLSASTSLVIGAGTANTLLGLTAGSSTNVSIVTERPIVWPFAIGAGVTIWVNPQHDIDINLNGANLFGAVGQLSEVTGGIRYAIRNINYYWRAQDPGPTAVAAQIIGLDIGTVGGEVAKINALNQNTKATSPDGYGAIFLQGNERSSVHDCTLYGFNSFGVTIGDSYACSDINNWTSQCGYAHVIATDISNLGTLGSYDCSVEGGGDVGSTYGLVVNGAERTKVVNFSSLAATVYGANLVHNTVHRTVDTTLTGCSFINAPIGVVIEGLVTGTRIFGLNTNNCQGGITCSSDLMVDGWTMITSVNRGANVLGIFNGPGPYSIENFELVSSTSGPGFSIGCTGSTSIKKGVITVSNVDICITNNGNGTVYIDNVVFTGGYGLQCNAGTIIVGPNCDFSGCNVAPFVPGAAGKIIWMNQGGVLSLSLAGFPSYGLTAAQLSNTCIELNGLLGADTIVYFQGPNVGEEWTVTNNTTGAHTLTLKEFPIVGAGFTIAQGKTMIVRINSASTLQQVTAAF